MNRAGWSLIILTGLSLFHSASLAASTQDSGSVATTRLYRLPLPLNSYSMLRPNMADTLAAMLLTARQNLQISGLTVVVHISEQDSSLARYRAYGLLVDLKSLVQAAEVMVLTEATMLQIPDDSHTSGVDYFPASDAEYDKKSAKSAGKIYTEFNIEIEYVNIASEEILGLSQIAAGGSAPTDGQSQRNALANLQAKTELELLRIYDLSADLAGMEDRRLQVNIGQAALVKKGMIFTLYQPDERIRQNKRTLLVDGKPVGFARVVQCDSQHSQLHVDRQWRQLTEKSWALAQQNFVSSWYLALQPAITGQYAQYGIYWQDNPLTEWSVGIGINFIQVQDSQDERDNGFGFSFFAARRFWDGRRLDIRFRSGMDLDFPFRKDHNEYVVSTLMFSLHFAVAFEWTLGYCSDLVCNAGYRLGRDANTWDYTQDDQEYPAYWETVAPTVNARGFFLSVGYRYALF